MREAEKVCPFPRPYGFVFKRSGIGYIVLESWRMPGYEYETNLLPYTHMANKDDVVRKLRVSVILQNKEISEGQLLEAAAEVIKLGHVKKADLQELGQKVAGDRQIFATTDTEEMNNLLGRLGEK